MLLCLCWGIYSYSIISNKYQTISSKSQVWALACSPDNLQRGWMWANVWVWGSGVFPAWALVKTWRLVSMNRCETQQELPHRIHYEQVSVLMAFVTHKRRKNEKTNTMQTSQDEKNTSSLVEHTDKHIKQAFGDEGRCRCRSAGTKHLGFRHRNLTLYILQSVRPPIWTGEESPLHCSCVKRPTPEKVQTPFCGHWPDFISEDGYSMKLMYCLCG